MYVKLKSKKGKITRLFWTPDSGLSDSQKTAVALALTRRPMREGHFQSSLILASLMIFANLIVSELI